MFGRLLAGIIGLFLFIIILVLLFGRGGKKPTPGPTILPLADYAETTATVSFTTDGMVNGDEIHRSIRITVSSSQRQLDILQGYNPQVISSKSFINNQEAYNVFLKSIGFSGFLAKSNKKNIPASEIGQCPLGFRYILNLEQDGDDLSRLWASTCGKAVGNATGNILTIRSLFQNQIPDYTKLTNTVNLSMTTSQ